MTATHNVALHAALEHAVLDFGRHETLTQLPDSVCGLCDLRRLKLSWCPLLIALPDKLGLLACLTHLHISNCIKLQSLPESLGQLKSLEDLHVGWCDSIVTLPGSLGCLSNLKILVLEYCFHLRELPETMRQLRRLIRLCVIGCVRLKKLPFCAETWPADTCIESHAMEFPPIDVVKRGMHATRAYMQAHGCRLRMLILIMASRRRRLRHVPAELWVLIRDEYF